MSMSEIVARIIELSSHRLQPVPEVKPWESAWDFSGWEERKKLDQPLELFLSELEPEQLITALGIMYIGRHDDLDIVDFKQTYDYMERTFPSPERCIRQMVEKSPLPRYLRDGLQIFREYGISFDDLCYCGQA